MVPNPAIWVSIKLISNISVGVAASLYEGLIGFEGNLIFNFVKTFYIRLNLMWFYKVMMHRSTVYQASCTNKQKILQW